MKAINRLLQYLDYKGIKPTPFEAKADLSNGYLGKQLKRNANLGEEIINKIIDNCPDLSIEWLIRGKLPMIKESNLNVVSEPREEHKITPKIIELNPEAKANTLVANVKASAGFGSLLQDTSRLEELPAITLPNAPYGLNVAFQIDGDSMHPSIQHLSHVAGNQLNSLDDFRNGYVYIVIDKYDGAVCKRVYRTSNGYELVSDNPKYPPYERTYEEVLGLFRAFGRYSTDFRSYYDDLRIDIKKINDRLLKIENRLNA